MFFVLTIVRYDGNSVIGHRMYREVNTVKLKQKHKVKNCLDMLEVNCEWETLATNLEEFRKLSVCLFGSINVPVFV